MAAYAPYEPLDTLKPVAEDLWIVDGGEVRMAFGAGVRVPFPTRMTVARLSDGSLWCHSPTRWTHDLGRQIAALGRVRHLVSPNRIHYAWIPEWQRRYPAASAWASPGVRERAGSQGVEISFDRDLEDAAPPDWSADFEQMIFRGSRFMDEVLFLHRPSKTLIVADLIENFERDRMRGKWRWLLPLSGAMDPDGKMPIDLRLTFLGRRSTARKSRERLLAWSPERIILAHGRWYPARGRAELERAMRWLD